MDESLITFILTMAILLVMTLVTSAWLFRLQKKNRRFEKKGFFLYIFVGFFIFALLGLVGLSDQKELFSIYTVLQCVALLAGILTAWGLFTFFEWPDRDSLLPETLFTLATGAIIALGFGLSYWLFDRFLGPDPRGNHLFPFILSILWFPVPYLILRTYDLMLHIPAKRFAAWYYPDRKPQHLDFRDSNVVYIYLYLDKDASGSLEKRISDHRSRLPKNATLGAFFHHFILDYNDKYPSDPILYLQNDKDGAPIGWTFHANKSARRRGRFLDPDKIAFEQLKEGASLSAHRVPIDKEYAAESLPLQKLPDDEIIIRNHDDGSGGATGGDIVINEKT